MLTLSYLLLFPAGPLCLAKHRPGKDRRLDDDFATFKKFNRSLQYSCENGDPASLEFTPNTSWPDVVYYNSFTQANMGWKIHIIDSFSSTRSSGFSIQPPNISLLFISTYYFYYSINKIK